MPIAPGVTVELWAAAIRAGGRVLLEHAAATFEPGQVTLIVGPSGAGKTTLLRLLAGLLGEGDEGIEASGTVTLDDVPASPAQRRRSVGVVFQSHALFDEFSPLANVRLAAAHHRRRAGEGESGDRSRDLLQELGVPLHVRTSALSGGQRQRLAVARTLAYDPDVILYDEPTAGLDAATAAEVATLIRATQASHPKTSIVVTHDYQALAPIADRIYLLDPQARALRRIDRTEWSHLREQLRPLAADEPSETRSPSGRLRAVLGRGLGGFCEFLAGTTRAGERVLAAVVALLPIWRRPLWGLRFLLHYLRLVAGPSAWAYLAISGAIIGFVTTYFTFRFLPFARYSEPLLIEDLLTSMGFALYRILVPVLATILIAARCGAAVASDMGGKSYSRQLDALRTIGVRPRSYLLTPILYSFLLGTPLLTWISYQAAAATSLAVFTATHADLGPDFWQSHFERRLVVPDAVWLAGSGWWLAKLLLCAAGIGLIAYHGGASPKHSGRDVSQGITASILWATLYVLVIHFIFAFCEFE